MPLVDDRTIELADIAKQTGSNTAQADGLACVFDLNSPGAIYPSHEFSRSQKNKLAQNKVMYNSMNSKCYTFRAYEADTLRDRTHSLPCNNIPPLSWCPGTDKGCWLRSDWSAGNCHQTSPEVPVWVNWFVRVMAPKCCWCCHWWRLSSTWHDWRN